MIRCLKNRPSICRISLRTSSVFDPAVFFHRARNHRSARALESSRLGLSVQTAWGWSEELRSTSISLRAGIGHRTDQRVFFYLSAPSVHFERPPDAEKGLSAVFFGVSPTDSRSFFASASDADRSPCDIFPPMRGIPVPRIEEKCCHPCCHPPPKFKRIQENSG